MLVNVENIRLAGTFLPSTRKNSTSARFHGGCRSRASANALARLTHPAAPGDVLRRGTVQRPRTRPPPDTPPSQKDWHFGCVKHPGVKYSTPSPLLRVPSSGVRRFAAFGVWRANGSQAMCKPTPATSPSRWAAPGSQDLRGSSPAFLSYSCFAAERHFGQIAVGRAFRRFVAARAARGMAIAKAQRKRIEMSFGHVAWRSRKHSGRE